MNQPTPGPWEVSDERECEMEHFASILSHAEGHKGVEVCVLQGGHPYRNGEGLANARLIAAAPDLYGACKAWMDWMDSPGDGTDKSLDDEAAMLDAMRAALAKAGGRR